MGTGEGVQTFGWGLYFTDLEDIAINYANKLSDTSIKTLSIGLLDLVRNGRWVGYDLAKTETERRIVEHFAINEKEITDAYNEGKDLNKAVLLLLQDFINDEKQELKNASSPYSTRDNDVVYYTNSIREAESLKKKIIKINIVSNRNLYAVSLHKGKTPNQYTWLEWDKALRNQSNATKTALEKHFSLESFDEDFATAGDFYKSRARKFDSQEKASKELLSLGIDGIKYPAESISRGTTSDTARGFNYVVFDENAINIEKQSQFENKNTMKDLITQKLHEMVEENHNELQNYMFFNNLKTLHDAIGELLEMNPQQVDQILSDGHNWALDHMATATDDIEEVYHFLNATMDGHEPDSYEGETEPGYSDDFGSVEVYRMNESEYKGKKVKLGKPMRGDVKKFKVFVKNKSGKVVKVNFGDKKMEIKRDNPKRRKSFRARHKCSQAKDRTTPKYWSCRMWSKKPVSKIV